ncbi:hypothetical protein CC2G_015317 [Coprinopsis cinerea AmutBmut pab1-1]|nr:hypothetical protein CC2G_015317 [Coprinopsis cinerea AmutBmut pab1-1]
MSADATGNGSFRLEPLNATNWMPWKRRMTAVLRELDLDKYVTGDLKTRPTVTADGVSPAVTTSDVATWDAGESKARTRLELAIGDTEMAHILGANTAAEIWTRLCEIKETKGRLGILATRRALYRATLVEGGDLVEHISTLRAYQSELALMSNVVSEEDFAMVIITSLPESWDSFTSSYLASQGADTTLKATEIIPLLLEEDRRRRTRIGSSAHSLQVRPSRPHAAANGGNRSSKECFNCKKKGHLRKDCWARGGGMEGRGPRGRGRNRSNQATDSTARAINSAVAITYMARLGAQPTPPNKLMWYLDSGTTSYICTNRDAFIDFIPLQNTTVQGIGPESAIVEGSGSIILNFRTDGTITPHLIRDVLFVPSAPNCLLSLSRFDDGGGVVHFGGGTCRLLDGNGSVVGTGRKVDRLYKLDAEAELHQNKSFFSGANGKKAWDDWHRILGHIAMSTVKKMFDDGLVTGLTIDTSSVPSPTCTACLGANIREGVMERPIYLMSYIHISS